VGCAIAVGVLARLVLQADPAATWRAVSSAGPLVLTALLPFAVGMTIDAWGTSRLLRALGHRASLGRMLPVRLASEALHVTLPAGFLAADTATALLLERACDVPVRDGVVASIARKWLVMRSHAAYIAVGGVAGIAALGVLAHVLRVAALPWIVLGSAVVPLVLSMAVGSGLLGGSPFARLHAACARLPSRRLARWLESRKADAVATDVQIARLRGDRTATALATLAFLGGWCFEALESALLLRLVGATVDLPSVFAVEAGLSMVRSIVVLLPSGLGVVDMGYATVMRGLGVDPSAAAAFVLLRRAKEAAWVGIGYAILAASRRPARAAAAAPVPRSHLGPEPAE
jgi:uncharacterized membrane protein YbhN (UPF0104 family)